MTFRFLALLRLGAFAFCGIFSSGAASGAATAWNPGLELKLDAAAGVSGGTERGTSLHGLALAHVRWEPGGTAAGWRGFASVLGLAGRGPTGKYLGDFLAASNTEGFESVRLYTWWLERNAGPWSLRAGALLADEEFTGTESGGHLINSSFGWPAFISANTVNTGPAFYVAAPGIRLNWSKNESLSWRVGIYDGDTFDSPAGDPAINRHGWHYGLGGAQGWFVIGETDIAFGAERASRLKLGAWLHTADFADVYRDVDGQPLARTGNPPRLHNGNFGAYAVFERHLAGRPGEPGSIDAHLRVGVAPQDRNALGWVLDTGVAWRGPLPGRPGDVLAIGFTHANFSADLAAAGRLAAPGTEPLDHEQVCELTYIFALRKGLTLQPDMQWAIHPGGSAALADSLLLTLRINASF